MEQVVLGYIVPVALGATGPQLINNKSIQKNNWITVTIISNKSSMFCLNRVKKNFKKKSKMNKTSRYWFVGYNKEHNLVTYL